jgi:predicted GNAT family acetyltransferase
MRAIEQEGNKFVVHENGELAGEITFVPVGDSVLEIDHTYVSPALRGQTLAQDLVRRVVEFAREKEKKIIPTCAYALAQFRRNKDYGDVWQRDEA